MAQRFVDATAVGAQDHLRALFAEYEPASVTRGEMNRLRAIEREARAIVEAVIGPEEETTAGLPRIFVHGPALEGLVRIIRQDVV